MSVIRFEWDETKNQLNIRRHHVSFGEAKSVFYDPNALLIHDPDHSEDDEVIRIISARKANTAEKMQYGG